jgi:hypothetical protein
MAHDYLELTTRYPVTMRTAIFHVRRILKHELTQYQLMDDCLACTCLDELLALLGTIESYRNNPELFVYNRDKATQERLALERKQQEEGKRKAYEARLMRKAKREGKTDLQFYLRVGAMVPTEQVIKQLKELDPSEALDLWKKDHSQHCMKFHLDPNGCQRGPACAFLHVHAAGSNAFEEMDEVAG